NFLFGCATRKTDNLDQKRFSQRMALSRILKIKASRDTKVFFKGILYPLFDLLSFLFLLTISRPPGGMSKQKKSFTLYAARQQPRKGHSRQPNASGALAEPEPPHEPESEPDP